VGQAIGQEEEMMESEEAGNLTAANDPPSVKGYCFLS